MKKSRSRTNMLSLSSTSGQLSRSTTKNESGLERKMQLVTAGALEHMQEASPFFDSNPGRALPVFDIKEIHTGNFLGEGEFGIVLKVARITDESRQELKTLLMRDEGLSGDDVDGTAAATALQEAKEMRDIVRERCWRDDKARYAIKRLKDGLGSKKLVLAVVDLAAEQKFLASISHPNIIKLRGTAGQVGDPQFMLILDRLHVSMNDQLQEWKEAVRSNKNFLGRIKNKEDHVELLTERVVAAYDIARALNYLHGHNILYRDCKPENMGFDCRGDVRIFDFGISKELKAADLVNAPDEYKCTGLTGSRRWMAPEVCLCLPYGLKVDVYAFGLFFWQLCTLNLPFGTITEDWHLRFVVKQGTRPTIPASIPSSVRQIIKACWSPKACDRPTFNEICKELPDVITLLNKQMSSRTSILDRSRHLLDQSINSRQFYLDGLQAKE